MDSGTIFYIIAVVIYFIYSAFQQKKNQPNDGELPDGRRPQESADLPKTVTFEDLLREIRKAQGGGEEKMPVPAEVEERSEPVEAPSYRQPAKSKEVTTVPSPEGLAEKYEKYQRKQPLVKLDDLVDIYDSRRILGEVKSSVESPRPNRYAKLLRDPKSLKDAVVVSEILNRKHF